MRVKKWDVFLFLCTAGAYGNDGCNGGNMKASFRYMISNKGINSAFHYPYKARVSARIEGLSTATLYQ